MYVKNKYFPKNDTKFKSLLKHLNEFKKMICYDEWKKESLLIVIEHAIKIKYKCRLAPNSPQQNGSIL